MNILHILGIAFLESEMNTLYIVKKKSIYCICNIIPEENVSCQNGTRQHAHHPKENIPPTFTELQSKYAMLAR